MLQQRHPKRIGKYFQKAFGGVDKVKSFTSITSGKAYNIVTSSDNCKSKIISIVLSCLGFSLDYLIFY